MYMHYWNFIILFIILIVLQLLYIYTQKVTGQHWRIHHGAFGANASPPPYLLLTPLCNSGTTYTSELSEIKLYTSVQHHNNQVARRKTNVFIVQSNTSISVATMQRKILGPLTIYYYNCLCIQYQLHSFMARMVKLSVYSAKPQLVN